MLGQPDEVRSSPSKIVMFHHHSWEPYGELRGRGEQADACWDSNIMFIHTSKKQDDVPRQLVMLQVWLVKLSAHL